MPVADPIAALLAGAYPDPESGELLACEARSIAIEDSLAGREVELVRGCGLGRRLALICDVDTHAALGRRVELALAQQFHVQRVMLPHAPHADIATIAHLLDQVEPGTEGIVTVGSGTLNDLSKMVALHLDLPHVVFATAPSMNGYTSVSASITEGGFKRSVRARTPCGVFLDLRILADAPVRLIRAGLGDSVCRATAQTDWLLSNAVLGTPYREAPFALLVDDEAAMLARAGDLVCGDLVAMRALARTLVLSGIGMTLVGGSFPASQSEHLISHYLEMMAAPDVVHALHGEQTGVAAVAMAGLQARVLAMATAPRLGHTAIDRDAVIAHFGPALGDTCWREFVKKQVPDLDATNARLAAAWPAIRARLARAAMPPATMLGALGAAGAPTRPSDLGYPPGLFDDALAHAREIRDRYTVLDFVADVA
ncbi:MAG: iron-containing alcohol dehydrogenase [Proteobacteria bacterium]|nr:iron-containing alcohol dehydrogenase [Pseudomonadota bacterium]